jgi:phenylacetate-CoA ligase
LFHEAIRDCGATVVVAGTGNTDLQIQIMKDLNITGFVGTPSFLMTVIKRAEEMGLDIKRDLSLKRAWFTGEMLPPSLRKTFEGDYDIDTYQAYAVTEPGGAIAYECRQKSGMHLMDEYITEIVDPETGKQLGPGEIGEIVTTQLFASAPATFPRMLRKPARAAGPHTGLRASSAGQGTPSRYGACSWWPSRRSRRLPASAR